MSRTPRDRLADIVEAAARVSRAVDALEHAEASDAEDEAQLAFDALLYRLVVIDSQLPGLWPWLGRDAQATANTRRSFMPLATPAGAAGFLASRTPREEDDRDGACPVQAVESGQRLSRRVSTAASMPGVADR